MTNQELQIVTERNKLNIARGDKMREFLKEYEPAVSREELKNLADFIYGVVK